MRVSLFQHDCLASVKCYHGSPKEIVDVVVPTPEQRAESHFSHIACKPLSSFSVATPRFMQCVILLTITLLTSCRVAKHAVAIPPELIARAFDNLQRDHPATMPGSETSEATREDPNWSVLMYIAAETDLKRKDYQLARKKFRDLAERANDQSKDPRSSLWGGSGLGVIALWRWFQLIDREGADQAEVGEALTVADSLSTKRVYSNMTQSGLLPSLPFIGMDVARLSAEIAYKANRPEAMSRFLDFMGVNSTGDLNALDQEIENQMVNQGWATEDRLSLFKLRRQFILPSTNGERLKAAQALHALWQNEKAPSDVRAEAGYEWASFNRRNAANKTEIVNVLTSAFNLEGRIGPVAEKALYLRGMIENSLGAKQPNLFFEDMNSVRRFPNGQLANDALYQIATEHMFGANPDLDQALADFEKLRASPDNHSWIDSAYLSPSMGLIERGKDRDLKTADQLLSEYATRFPDGAFRLRSLFWRGRIAEQIHDPATAKQFFQSIVNAAPYDYYGLRSSIHLNAKPGESPRSMALPPTDSEARRQIRAAYVRSKPEVGFSYTSPFHERLRSAGNNGLYAKVLRMIDGVQKGSGQRLDQIDLRILDQNGMLPAAALLLAYRQDAIAARDSTLTADNLLGLAGFLGFKVRDWPTAIAIASPKSGSSHELIQRLQNDSRYLATSFPNGSSIKTVDQALANAAWFIDRSNTLSQSLMYGVTREESYFYPGAISEVGALGLFQIMPATFRGSSCPRDENVDKSKPTPYLFDPDKNANFWSCWAQTDLAPVNRKEIATVMVKHNAGGAVFSAWRKEWLKAGIDNDLELQIDTYRFPATSAFVHYALRDVVVADAVGMFENGGSAGRETNP